MMTMMMMPLAAGSDSPRRSCVLVVAVVVGN
jgi:hypothetical protein